MFSPVIFLRDVGDGLVVAQRIEIVLVEAGAARGVEAVGGRGFAEVHLDRADAQLQQAGDLVLIPRRRWPDWRNPARRPRRAGCPWRRARRDSFSTISLNSVFFGTKYGSCQSEMRKPSFFRSAIIFCGILEARLGELVVAAPVGLEPAGVEVDHVAGDLVLAQLGGDFADLLLRCSRCSGSSTGRTTTAAAWATCR